ncbi:MAG: hypothetical protein J5714_03540 [Alphaproteobacteria bacterium]|nr:hypothetical protein [Alphaproteobacteria bacterium]
MSSEKKSFTNFWRAVAWTGIYVFVMWAILRGLFNFNMFSVAHLTKLLHLQLHGFAGFVFGILVLAAVPLYVATMVLTVRNKEMPVKLPLPKCFTDAPPAPTPAPVVPVVTANETLPELRAGVPPEMRETFMRAKKNYGARQMSVFNRPNAPVKANQTELVPEPVTESVVATKVEDVPAYGGMPIPTDFDMDASAETSNDVPVFADINFDDDDSAKDTTAADESPTEKVCALLRAVGVDANVAGDLIVANGYAIAVHDDDDFWVPDELDWFAAGKQKPSPIAALKKAESEQNLKPILYLATNSIMDIEEKSAEWIADGIMVVTDKDDLRKVLV